MAQRLRPGKSSGIDSHQSPNSHLSNGDVVSDTELSDSEPKEQNRRASLDHSDRPGEISSLSRNASTKGFNLKPKTSFSFRRRGSRPTDTSAPSQPIPEPEKPPPMTSAPHSPSMSSLFAYNGTGPTPAQSAYIQRVLAPSLSDHDVPDPLQKLQQANARVVEKILVSPKSGLIESLEAFTSVEVLEGENAFACKKCWKVKTGRYRSTQATLKEEDERTDLPLPPTASPTFTSTSIRSPAPPAISVIPSEPEPDGKLPHVESDQQLRRHISIPGARHAHTRAPSPFGGRPDDTDSSSATAAESTSLHSDRTGNIVDSELDGLSDTDTSDEEPPLPSEVPMGRPNLPARKKSSHFVMRRAFKRYLIAKAPEILVFHFKRFKQTQKTALSFTSFYDLKKYAPAFKCVRLQC